MRAMLKLALPLCLAALVATAHAADVSPLAHLSFQPSMQAGYRDQNGKLVTGTEIMHLVPHKGRLYASTSLWMEKDPSVPKACQVLVLDSPKGQWRVEHQFTDNNLRYGTLREVTFSTDATGKAITPVSLLLAAPDVRRGPFKIYCREDATGEWSASVLGTGTEPANARSMGLHRDRVTRIDRIFAGHNKLGVVAGVYDPAAPGRLRWEKSGEFQTPAGDRVMGFCDCNGILYCATSHHLYQRTDGTAPAWKQIYISEQTGTGVIRGLTAVPKPGGTGEVLWFVTSGKVRRLDPAADFKETIELDELAFLTEKLGVKVNSVLAAYNELMPYVVPGTREALWLFGFQCAVPTAALDSDPSSKTRMQVREPGQARGATGKARAGKARPDNGRPANARPAIVKAGNGRYVIRHAQGADITYEVAEITDPREPQLVATRVISVSPFPEDQGRALYFGGYDCNGVPAHNTAWIYRGELAAKPAAQ